MADLTWGDVGGVPITRPTTPTETAPATAAPVDWGEVGGTPVAPAKPAKPALPVNDKTSPLSYTAGVLLGYNPPVSDVDKSVANVRAGLSRAPGTLVTFPHAFSALYDALAGNKEPNAFTQFTWDEPYITELMRLTGNKVAKTLGLPEQQPMYKPETTEGAVAQNIIAGAPAALMGGGGVAGAVARQLANVVGNVAPAVGEAIDPDLTPRGKAILGIGGALAGGSTPRVYQAAQNNALRFVGNPTIAEKTANARIANAADMSKNRMVSDLESYLDPNPPNPNTVGFGPNINTSPNMTTRDVLNDRGLNYYQPMAGVPSSNQPGVPGVGSRLLTGWRGPTGGAALGYGAGLISKALGGGAIPYVDPITGLALGSAYGLYNIGKNRYNDFQRQVGGIARRALDDPQYAQDLLSKYNGTDAQWPWSLSPNQYPGLLAPYMDQDFNKQGPQ